MSKSTTLTLKIVGNEDYSDVFPKAELTHAQRELIRFVAVTAVQEYIKGHPRIQTDSSHDRILRLPEVKRVTGLSRATIYLYIKNEKFPKAISLGSRSVGWKESHIREWLETKS